MIRQIAAVGIWYYFYVFCVQHETSKVRIYGERQNFSMAKGQQYNVRDKPTVIYCTYRHEVTPNQRQKQTRNLDITVMLY